jgi:hypothetical protein
MMVVFWVVAPYRLVVVYQRLRGACYLCHRAVSKPRAGNGFEVWKPVGQGTALAAMKTNFAVI